MLAKEPVAGCGSQLYGLLLDGLYSSHFTRLLKSGNIPLLESVDATICATAGVRGQDTLRYILAST